MAPQSMSGAAADGEEALAADIAYPRGLGRNRLSLQTEGRRVGRWTTGAIVAVYHDWAELVGHTRVLDGDVLPPSRRDPGEF
ncbi:MAG TPA: hypothetical protein DIC34_11700 [Treponema sp.]|nr:MAG: hypothetical protein A2001_10935 [Treponema sp. GWC1_61_84]OHE73508.1 MAG: hypothetical protein A2413_16625 [Treponema sp. RIFOXYC1_FULL_61_9]HCM27189.1 hypothetical protein [Treponema sp.]